MHDVLICGAGPAGSVVAQRLAAAGLRVALVGGTARPGWEGLSARSRGLLLDEGVDFGGVAPGGVDGRGDVIAGPFARRGAWSNGRSVEGIEWLVERAAMANALSARARERGAEWCADTVTSATRAGNYWRVALRGGAVLAARMVVDARGRGARRPLRQAVRRSGPVLLAIGQEFRWRTSSAYATGIGVTDTGWCWWAERGASLWVQIIGKPRSLHPAGWVAAAAAQIPALARALEGAGAEGAPVARAAHAKLGDAGGDDSLEPTFWLAGDAAMALDPLSGQGVYEAVRGARLVATAILSVTAGGDARVAQRFVAERREEAWLHGVSVAAGFYRENESCGSFWSQTAAAYEAFLPERVSASDVESRANALRRPTVETGVARIECRPVLDEGRILERDVIVTEEHPRGVWQVAGVPLAALQGYLEAAEHASVDAAAVVLDRTPAAVASAMSWLRERGPTLQRDLSRVSSGG